MRNHTDKQLGRPLRRIVTTMLACLLLATTGVSAMARQADAVQQELEGVFSMSLTPEILADGISDAALFTGRWTLTLNNDGMFSLARADVGEVASGSFTAGPASLSFDTWQGVIGCAIATDGAPAEYAWRMANQALTLTTIADSCPERQALLTQQPLGQASLCVGDDHPASDPFAVLDEPSEVTQAAETPTRGSGVTAQEGSTSDASPEAGVDTLLAEAAGCWAVSDLERFMALHSSGLVNQLAMMGPPEAFNAELSTFMEASLRLQRIGQVHLEDPDHAWAYVEITLDGLPNPQRVNFVRERDRWRFDSFFLFGPPVPVGPSALGA